jgi:acyl-CoA reductase-like NAD-dependent aldehyde dehydrogenase
VPYRSVNPATGELLKTFTEHTDQEMMEALAAADKAFVSWAALPIDGRAKNISHAAQLLLERKSELARLAKHASAQTDGGELCVRLNAKTQYLKRRKDEGT